MLPYYTGEYESTQKIIDFESAKKNFLWKQMKNGCEKTFERIYNAAESMAYTK